MYKKTITMLSVRIRANLNIYIYIKSPSDKRIYYTILHKYLAIIAMNE